MLSWTTNSCGHNLITKTPNSLNQSAPLQRSRGHQLSIPDKFLDVDQGPNHGRVFRGGASLETPVSVRPSVRVSSIGPLPGHLGTSVWGFWSRICQKKSNRAIRTRANGEKQNYAYNWCWCFEIKISRPNFRTACKISARSIHACIPYGKKHVQGNLSCPG